MFHVNLSLQGPCFQSQILCVLRKDICDKMEIGTGDSCTMGEVCSKESDPEAIFHERTF